MKKRLIKLAIPCILAIILAPVTVHTQGVEDMGTSFLIGVGFGFIGAIIGIVWGFGDWVIDMFK